MEIEFTIRCSANVKPTEITCNDIFDISEDELKEYIGDSLSVSLDDCNYLEYYIEDAYEM